MKLVLTTCLSIGLISGVGSLVKTYGPVDGMTFAMAAMVIGVILYWFILGLIQKD